MRHQQRRFFAGMEMVVIARIVRGNDDPAIAATLSAAAYPQAAATMIIPIRRRI
ncbi:MAG TPA: hypothetical protein VFE46_01515 [Pirellulales bacterium]|jgi:hypothetical protein|nr:hypothetical protein [Pirellulales bacterium]